MNQYYSDVISFTGNHYDFGYMQGELLKKSPIIENRRKQWGKGRKHRFTINEQEALDLFSTYMPAMIEELQGLADALGWTMAEALRDFGGYYVEYERSGCSIFTGANYLVRNYDSHPAGYEGRYVIYQPTDLGYATIGPTMQITGRTDGMNEKGLVMGYNFINRIGSDDGFICNMIGRMVLETCATVSEAIDLLKEIPHRTSFNYVVTDPTGETYVVEASPREVVARKSQASTNHFEILTEENRYHMKDSLRRMDILNKQEKLNTDPYAAYQLLNNEEHDIFSDEYAASAGTIHTAAYLPKEKKAFFALGGNRKPIIFDLDRYLKGDKINVTKIKGELDFHTAFVNMQAFHA